MTKATLNTICLTFLSLFVVACGDAGGGAFEGEHGFEEEVIDQDELENVDEEQNEENDADQEEEIEVEDDEVIETPFCGDGFLDAGEECDDANALDGDGCSSDCELEPVFAEGEISIEITVDSLISNEAPLTDTCVGVIDLTHDDGTIDGDGQCFLTNNANVMTYVLDVTVDDDGVVDGNIEITFNGRPHELRAEGLIVDGVLLVEFTGVTLATQNVRLVWNGQIDAEFE